jgi:AraC-like DNA-binding protein
MSAPPFEPWRLGESFARWHVPRQIDGIVLVEDFSQGRGRVGLEQRHHHAELEIHLVARGRGTFLLGEERFDGEAGTLLWVPPGHDHTLLEATRDFRRWMLLFRPRTVRRVLPPGDARTLLTKRPQSSSERLCRTLGRRELRELTGLYADARSTMREQASLYNAAIGYALARSFTAFSTAAAIPSASTLHPAVAEAVRRLKGSVPPPSREQLARHCALSEWHLSKLFHAQVGVPLTEFRNRCRLERFFELYGDGTRHKLTAAALDAGFGSYPQFHRVFRAHVGYPPAEHARRMRLG